ncbi:MAG: pyridoxal phosphate-dependent aminotransferase [Vicinamibacterales bacterium]
MFSTRTPDDLTPNRFSTVLRQLRQQGRPLIDLTLSNPTTADLPYPADLLEPLADPRGLAYRPTALGQVEARQAVSNDFARRGVSVPAERIALTASTSEAYSLLFKVLCDPGDEVLVPRPSYPLFEHLTRLDGVVALPYELEYHRRWEVNVATIESAISPRTRAVLVVSPNNPTGSFLKAHELERLEALCRPAGMAIIADEVFADYPFVTDSSVAIGHAAATRETLSFSLGGLSKSIGLPQAKLGWVGVGGPAPLAARAITRLEFVCDTYLSVSTPVQASLAQLLERGAVVRASIQARVVTNFRRLLELSRGTPSCDVLDAEGGWYAVLQVPTLGTEEDLVLQLLTTYGVVVHPGYFFDFPRESYLVLSLLTPPAQFEHGVCTILRHFDCRVGGHDRR